MMAKRDTGAKAAPAMGADTQDAMNERLAEMAEQLGRMAGRLAARADSLRDQEALGQQIASVRDGASSLLEQLRAGAASLAAKVPAVPTMRGGTTPATGRSAKTNGQVVTATSATAPARTRTATAAARGRSGGVVDAPGKKHRTAPPEDIVGRGRAAGQTARRLAATTMVKTARRRGRG
jgi:hypothetical protein